MDIVNHLQSIFVESIKTKESVMQSLLPQVAKAGELLAATLKAGGKVLSCGNGGSACDAQHFTGEIVGRFQIERDGLAAVSLTADTGLLTALANDYGYENLFSRQVKALGRKNDLLLAISTSGNSKNIINSIGQAHSSGLRVVALTGKDGGKIAKALDDQDVEIRVPSKVTARIQEVHILIIHSLCEIVDRVLFADKFEEK